MDNAKMILDLSNWQGFVLILVALLGLFVLAGNAVKTWRELKKPKESAELTEKEKLRDVVMMLENHEKQIDELREGLTCMCQASQALLNHSLHNGNTGEMEEASTAIAKYLRKKI